MYRSLLDTQLIIKILLYQLIEILIALFIVTVGFLYSGKQA